MGEKWNLLRFEDVPGAYRLIGGCRDLGSDPALWYQRIFDGLRELIGAPATPGGEARWVGPHRGLEPTAAFGSGFDAHGWSTSCIAAATHTRVAPDAAICHDRHTCASCVISRRG